MGQGARGRGRMYGAHRQRGGRPLGWASGGRAYRGSGGPGGDIVYVI